jgi:hypothetical protein
MSRSACDNNQSMNDFPGIVDNKPWTIIHKPGCTDYKPGSADDMSGSTSNLYRARCEIFIFLRMPLVNLEIIATTYY